MAERLSHRGAGRDAAGPLVATVRLHDWIKKHPGITRDELVAAALEHDMVDRGYAHRRYMVQLNQGRSLSQCPRLLTMDEVASNRSDQAVRFIVKDAAKKMRDNGSIADEDGRLYARRELRQIKGLPREQIVDTRDQTREHMAAVELLRDLRPILDELDAPSFKLKKDVRVKLQHWAEMRIAQGGPGN